MMQIGEFYLSKNTTLEREEMWGGTEKDLVTTAIQIMEQV